MASKIKTIIRSIRDLSNPEGLASFADPRGLLQLSPSKLKAIQANPYLDTQDQPCQLVGILDGRVVGRRNSYLERIVAYGKTYVCRTSGSVYVDPSCRSSLYAISLLEQALKLPLGDLNINCFLSKQNQKFFRLLGSAMFQLELFEAGGRWNKFFKAGTRGGWRAIAAKIINGGIAFANYIFDKRRWRGLPDWSIVEVDCSDKRHLEKFCKLISRDTHHYRCDISKEWIKWALSCDFDLPNCKKALWAVNDGQKLVGYALVRRDFVNKYAKIFEWQINADYENVEAEFLSIIARKLYHYAYRVQIAVGADSSTTIAKLGERFYHCGHNFAVVTIADGSRFEKFDGIRDSTYWRIRPGMGDAAFW